MDQIDKIIDDTYKNVSIWNTSEYKFILCIPNRGYEYNIHTHKIRPFTSAIWFSIDDDCISSFIKYFDQLCNDTLSEILNTGYISSDNVVNQFGYVDNFIIVMDINQISDAIDSDTRQNYLCYNKWNKLHDELDLFLNKLNKLYDLSESILKSTIKNQLQFI